MATIYLLIGIWTSLKYMKCIKLALGKSCWNCKGREQRSRDGPLCDIPLGAGYHAIKFGGMNGNFLQLITSLNLRVLGL